MVTGWSTRGHSMFWWCKMKMEQTRYIKKKGILLYFRRTQFTKNGNFFCYLHIYIFSQITGSTGRFWKPQYFKGIEVKGLFRSDLMPNASQKIILIIKIIIIILILRCKASSWARSVCSPTQKEPDSRRETFSSASMEKRSSWWWRSWCFMSSW